MQSMLLFVEVCLIFNNFAGHDAKFASLTSSFSLRMVQLSWDPETHHQWMCIALVLSVVLMCVTCLRQLSSIKHVSADAIAGTSAVCCWHWLDLALAEAPLVSDMCCTGVTGD
jgi:hypothetical protein